MIGQTIHSQRPVSPGVLAMVLIGVALLVLAVALESIHPAIFAVGPLTVALMAWLNQPRSVVFLVEENALAPIDGTSRIEFASIRQVTIGGRSPDLDARDLGDGPIRVFYESGVYEIPARLSVPSRELYTHLVQRMPRRVDRPLPELLGEAFREQVERFGAEQVVVVHQRELPDNASRGNWIAVFGPTLFLTGIFWCSAVLLDPEDDAIVAWVVAGGILVFVGAIVWILQSTRRRSQRRALRRHGPACIVLGPAGLALTQHDLSGQLRWEEVTRLKYGAEPNFGSSRKSALQLHVAGGRISILDIYERPLSEIAHHIAQNTQQPMPR